MVGTNGSVTSVNCSIPVPARRDCCTIPAALFCTIAITRLFDMNLGLANKIAMVGGASKGLGFAVADALARAGARVSIASRDKDAIEAAATKLRQDSGATVFAHAC